MEAKQLLERIRTATAPCRELDGEIWRYMNRNNRVLKNLFVNIEGVWHLPDAVHATILLPPPDYTWNTHDAELLFPTSHPRNVRTGHWSWVLTVDPGNTMCYLAYENGDTGIIEETGFGVTPALAMCHAAVKIQAYLEENGHL